MADISLTASMRSNLLSLQNTQSLMDTTQERLSTGKKVNSAIDNPSSYYAAQSLTNRASDLSALLDSMGQGIQTIKAADEAIEAITSFAQQAKAIANTARDTAPKTVASSGTYTAPTGAAGTIKIDVTLEDGTKTSVSASVAEDGDIDAAAAALETALNADRTGVADADGTIVKGFKVEVVGGQLKISNSGSVKATVSNTDTAGAGLGLSFSGTVDNTDRQSSLKQYNDILSQIDQLAKDASYKGVNLLGGKEQTLKVVFNEDRSSSLTIQGVDGSASGLGMTEAKDWSTNEAIDASITAVDGAISKLRNYASEFGNNYSVVQNREDFTENLINVLEEGADKLTLADMNEESANMLALQTRQQLAINSLSLASQAAQSVLSLF